MVFNAIFKNFQVISWRSVLLVEETGIPREKHQHAVSHWQTVSHNVVSNTPRLSGVRTHNVSDDRHWLHTKGYSCISIYHTITPKYLKMFFEVFTLIYNKFNFVTFYWSSCIKPRKWAVMYMYVRDIKFAYFYDFSIEFWNCFDSLIFILNFIIG